MQSSIFARTHANYIILRRQHAYSSMDTYTTYPRAFLISLVLSLYTAACPASWKKKNIKLVKKRPMTSTWQRLFMRINRRLRGFAAACTFWRACSIKESSVCSLDKEKGEKVNDQPEFTKYTTPPQNLYMFISDKLPSINSFDRYWIKPPIFLPTLNGLLWMARGSLARGAAARPCFSQGCGVLHPDVD